MTGLRQTHLLTFNLLVLIILVTHNFLMTTGAPQTLPLLTPEDSFESGDTFSEYFSPYAEPISDYRLSRLRRGYYYVDNGYITAVPASRVVVPSPSSTVIKRQDNDEARFTPVLGYRQQKTKHKKLFVPNLYG